MIMRPHPLLLGVLAVLGCSKEQGLACMAVDSGQKSCPSAEEVDVADLADPFDCDNVVTRVLDQETPVPETGVFQVAEVPGCCYEAIVVDRSPNSECMVGRPFLKNALPGAVEIVDPVGAAWFDLARSELASVAAFSKLQLELLAHAAPLDLLCQVGAAIGDELRHATLLQGYAEKKAGSALPFQALSMPAALPLQLSLAELAAATVREGCVSETLSALLTREAARLCVDPDLKKILFEIADDEDRHVVLSWAVVRWALSVGGAPVRLAVEAAFAENVRWGAMVAVEGWASLGLLGPKVSADVVRAGVDAVILPARGVLLGV